MILKWKAVPGNKLLLQKWTKIAYWYKFVAVHLQIKYITVVLHFIKYQTPNCLIQDVIVCSRTNVFPSNLFKAWCICIYPQRYIEVYSYGDYGDTYSLPYITDRSNAFWHHCIDVWNTIYVLMTWKQRKWILEFEENYSKLQYNKYINTYTLIYHGSYIIQ